MKNFESFIAENYLNEDNKKDWDRLISEFSKNRLDVSARQFVKWMIEKDYSCPSRNIGENYLSEEVEIEQVKAVKDYINSAIKALKSDKSYRIDWAKTALYSINRIHSGNVARELGIYGQVDDLASKHINDNDIIKKLENLLNCLTITT